MIATDYLQRLFRGPNANELLHKNSIIFLPWKVHIDNI